MSITAREENVQSTVAGREIDLGFLIGPGSASVVS